MDDSRIAEQALEAHRLLDQQITRLKLEFKTSFEASIQDWLANCTRHFRHFYSGLLRHMEIEESDGFLLPVRQRRPTLTRRVEDLLREHRDMTNSCEAIDHFMQTLKAPQPEDVVVIRKKIDALLTELEQHEEAENKLVQDVFTQDIGAVD